MKNKSNSVLLLISIFAFLSAVVFSTFAFLKVKEKYIGSFNVELETEGVDVFEVVDKKDCYMNVVLGQIRDVTATGSMGLKLSTTNDSATYCYKIDVELPKEKVFVYTSDTPDLILNVYTKIDNNQEYLINEMDITEKTGKIDIDKIFKISTSKNKSAVHYIYADLAFLYKPLDQSVNSGKTYLAKLNFHLVNCETGESIS